MAWRGRRVGPEHEGDHHRVDQERFCFDIERYEAFREDGGTIPRATADDLRGVRADALVRRLRRCIDGGEAFPHDQQWRPGPLGEVAAEARFAQRMEQVGAAGGSSPFRRRRSSVGVRSHTE